MKELVLEIQRESDLKELLPVLDRLKIKYVSRKKLHKPSSKEIEEAVRIIREGADFSLRRFHDTLLSWGSIPVPLVTRLMLEGRPA